MNYTQNYHLSQWEATDQVLRSDFNQDNAKIDAALKKVDDRGLQLIREYETTEASNNVQIDLSDIDWNQWKVVHVDVIPAAGTSEAVRYGYFGRGDTAGPISLTWNHMMYMPLGQVDRAFMGIFWGKTCELVFIPSLTFLPIRRAFLSGEKVTDQVAVGTKIIIQGERM